jgi:lysyl-tRNA synthetase class II
MDITEKLFSDMVKEISVGTSLPPSLPPSSGYVIKYHPEGPGGTELTIDFSPPWKRIPMVEGLEEKLGVKLPPLDTEEARTMLEALCKKHDVACSNPRTVPRLLDKLVGEFLEVRKEGGRGRKEGGREGGREGGKKNTPIIRPEEENSNCENAILDSFATMQKLEC